MPKAKLCRRVKQPESNLLNRITFLPSWPHTCWPAHRPQEGWQLLRNHMLSFQWNNSTWPERTQWVFFLCATLSLCCSRLCRCGCSEWNACDVLMRRSAIWYLTCHMIMSLMCISMSFLSSFHSDLRSWRMEREMQTQGTEIPKAKVGLYTWK